MHILLVEDDDRVADYVAKGLRENGHLLDHQKDGRGGLIQAMTEDYELIILDRMLPKLDGLALLKALRAAGNNVPVLMLTALGNVEERVLGLESGADDYLAKPFAITELSARVNVLGRRQRVPAEDSQITVSDLEINLLSRSVRRAGRRIDLTPREFRLLEVLARSVDRVVTRSMLLERVWEYSFDPQTNIVDQFMSKLRQKIDRDAEYPLIHTIRGAGYMLRRSS